ncbi:hypothetical protein AB3N59_02885 [Leptospira sp. WS92.C1]
MEINTEMFDLVWDEIFRDIDIRHRLEKIKIPVYFAMDRYDYLMPVFGIRSDHSFRLKSSFF